jgi:hypothetical protein
MKSITSIFGLLTFAIGVGALTSTSALAADAMGDATFINGRDVKWGDAPPVLPKGAKFAVLFGDPGKPGPYVIRLLMPAGYKIAPHWHTQAENLTIISGAFYLSIGDTMDKAHAHALTAGGYHYLPAKAHHSAYAGTRTIVQVSGEGPFDITYINPADDPSKAKPTP